MTPERLQDVIAEMREWAHGEGCFNDDPEGKPLLCVYYSQQAFLSLCDRIEAATTQQVPADGEWVPETELLALVAGPYMYHHKMDEAAMREARAFDRCRELTIQNIQTWCAMRRAMLAATQQAPQPVVDDNGLIVHGDWYTVEHTGTHIFDLDDDRERLLSILLHSNGDVGFAARVEGVGSWQGKATDPVFREALAEKETRLLQEAEKVLRQIADHKRKTKEQRLASSCVRFLDALRAELRSNA